MWGMGIAARVTDGPSTERICAKNPDANVMVVPVPNRLTGAALQ
jgi:hypothetical protein